MAIPQDTLLSGSTDSSLLRRARDHHADAWRHLVELYGPLVYGWCRWAHLQPADAADVVQEVFTALARSLPTFGPREAGSFRAWLRAITANKTCDHLRRLERRPQSPGGSSAVLRLHELPDPDDFLPSEQPPLRARTALVQQALEQLRTEIRDQTWQAFWRTTIDEQSPSDVAADLGMKAGAVYQAKSRTLIRLRDLISELEAREAADSATPIP